MNAVAQSEATASGMMTALIGMLDIDPVNVALLSDAAEAALDAHEPAVALDLLKRRATIATPSTREINLSGLAALQCGDFVAAEAMFATLFEAQQLDPGIRFNLAWALANLKEFARALVVLDDASARALPQAATLRVQLLHEAADFEGAADAAHAYLELFPDRSDLLAAVSVLALDIEDEPLAAACAAKAGDRPDALTALGTLALGDNHATHALTLFERALSGNAAMPRAWIGLGLARMMTGDSVTAPAALDKGAEMFGTHLGSWIAAGWGHFVNGDVATSRARFEAALALDANFAETHGSLAVLDVLGGDLESARRRSDVALRLDRQCYSAALARSLLAATRGDRESARRIFEHAAATPIGDRGRTIGQALARMGMSLP